MKPKTARQARLIVAIAIAVIAITAGLCSFPVLRALASADVDCVEIATGKICKLFLPIVVDNANDIGDPYIPTPAPYTPLPHRPTPAPTMDYTPFPFPTPTCDAPEGEFCQ
jgi:hypothetical protein